MKRILAAVFVVLGIIALCGLGVWQLQRLAWKEDLIARIAAYQQTDVDLTPYVRDPDAEFRRGSLQGTWDSAGTFQTRNITMNSNFGYWIVTPLVLDDASKILINRGWIYDGQQNIILGMKLPDGKVTVHGILRRPGALDKEDRAQGYPGPWVLFNDVPQPTSNPELIPVPVAVELPNDHKQYAIFWFTMAAVLAGMGGFNLLRKRSASSPDPSARES